MKHEEIVTRTSLGCQTRGVDARFASLPTVVVCLFVCLFVFLYLPHSHRETLSAAKTVAVLANSFATPMGAESFWWSSILVFNYCPRHFDCL